MNIMPKRPINLKGVTNTPFIDAMPVSNYILSIFHIILCMGNSLSDAFFEWIKERIELRHDVQPRNVFICASVLHETALAEYESWLENDGILLNNKEIDK